MNVQWHLEQVLSSWLRNPDRGDTVVVLVPPDEDPASSGTDQLEVWGLHHVLERLWDDDTPLIDPRPADVGLPPGCTYAQACRYVTALCRASSFPAHGPSDVVRRLEHQAPAPALPQRVLRAHRSVSRRPTPPRRGALLPR